MYICHLLYWEKKKNKQKQPKACRRCCQTILDLQQMTCENFLNLKLVWQGQYKCHRIVMQCTWPVSYKGISATCTDDERLSCFFNPTIWTPDHKTIQNSLHYQDTKTLQKVACPVLKKKNTHKNNGGWITIELGFFAIRIHKSLSRWVNLWMNLLPLQHYSWQKIQSGCSCKIIFQADGLGGLINYLTRLMTSGRIASSILSTSGMNVAPSQNQCLGFISKGFAFRLKLE